MKRENQIGCRVSFPSSFFMELEDCWKHEAGAHRALTFQGFLNMMVGFGLEAYKTKNFPQAPGEEPPEEAGAASVDDEAKSLFKEWDEVMEPPPPGLFNFPRNNRRPLLRFGGEQ